MNVKPDYKIQNITPFTYMPVKCQLHSAGFMETHLINNDGSTEMCQFNLDQTNL